MPTSPCPQATPLCHHHPQEHDGAFMDSVLQADLPLATMLAINHCHTWPTKSTTGLMSLLLAVSPSHNPWLWPPEKPWQDWVHWQQFLHKSLHTHADQFLLPLGNWLVHPYCTNFIPFDAKFQPCLPTRTCTVLVLLLLQIHLALSNLLDLLTF